MITGRTEEAPEGRDLDGIRHISIPFQVENHLVGVMDLSFLGSRRFTPDEMELFGAVGRMLSLAFFSCEETGSFEDLGSREVDLGGAAGGEAESDGADLGHAGPSDADLADPDDE